MATSNFLIFAENVEDENMETDTDYEVDTQRMTGVVPGIAVPKMHNKLYRQSTIMTAAIAQSIVQAGYNALDSDYSGLVANLRRTFAGSVNGVRPDATGNIDLTDVLNTIKEYATPSIGQIIITKDPASPAQKYTGTTWELVEEGTFIMAAGKTAAPGSTGGSNTHTITIAEIPKHNHGATESPAAGHNHTGNTNSVDLSGNFRSRSNMFYDVNKGPSQTLGTASTSGRFTVKESGLRADGNADDNRSDYIVHFDGNHNHSFTTSFYPAHKHDISISNTGGGQSYDSRPKYMAFYIWVRTA